MPEAKRAKPPGAGRRIAAVLRALTGRRPKETAAEDPARATTENPSAPTSGEEAAARIDAARARLRATIAAPDDDEEEPAENEKRGP